MRPDRAVPENFVAPRNGTVKSVFLHSHLLLVVNNTKFNVFVTISMVQGIPNSTPQPCNKQKKNYFKAKIFQNT